MKHLLILPILLPMFAGAVLLAAHALGDGLKRAVSLLATLALVPLALYLVLLADDGVLRAYALGNWQAPYGIALLLDRFSALMLLLTAVLASFALLYALGDDDQRGPNFHALFQFQLLGINGAFLTADLFNLFVFFEILLISSYSLLTLGNGRDQVKAGVHYVVLNLLGSAFFLIGVAMLYGLLGTLHMSDVASKVAQAEPDQAALISGAAYLLLLVFALKAAILPLYFWLPKAYAAAPVAVAALFAIMTKVGLYAIIRVFTLIFGEGAGPLAYLAHDLLWWLALATLAAGAVGALASDRLQMQLGYLVVLSVGTLLAGFALGSAQALTATLYYLLHSTLTGGAMFLLGGLIVAQRGAAGDDLHQLQAVHQPLLLGAMFFAGTIAITGLPPFSGFLGKLLLMSAAPTGLQAGLLWTLLLGGGLLSLIALSRAGSQLFWHSHGRVVAGTAPARGLQLLAALGLLLTSPLLLVFAQPLLGYLEAAAQQLLILEPYLQLASGGAA